MDALGPGGDPGTHEQAMRSLEELCRRKAGLAEGTPSSEFKSQTLHPAFGAAAAGKAPPAGASNLPRPQLQEQPPAISPPSLQWMCSFPRLWAHQEHHHDLQPSTWRTDGRFNWLARTALEPNSYETKQ